VAVLGNVVEEGQVAEDEEERWREPELLRTFSISSL
jgi:hypothetical protein